MPGFADELARHGIDALWYLAHIDNLPSLLTRGILSHNHVAQLGIEHARIDSRSIQQKRGRAIECDGRSVRLHDRVPTFLVTHQPMLYVQKDRSAIAHVELDLDVFGLPEVIFSNGNASKSRTAFFSSPTDLAGLDWDVLRNPNCYSEDYKWAKAAEVLLPSPVEPQFISRIHVRDEPALGRAAGLLPQFKDRMVVSSKLYPREIVTRRIVLPHL
jgi:hypothetical protein